MKIQYFKKLKLLSRKCLKSDVVAVTTAAPAKGTTAAADATATAAADATVATNCDIAL